MLPERLLFFWERDFYYLSGCGEVGVNRMEITGAVKTETLMGGSLAFPNARFGCAMLEEAVSASS
ncbi:MAG: hypothetical protein M3122_01415 [Actinomycetota bacterium]|nr:hypothetical protein [Actinomycetota bacterium]